MVYNILITSVDIQGEEDIEFQHENFMPFLILR